jgi:hypothetical protein
LQLKHLFRGPLLAYHARRGVFSVEIRSTVGMGAKLEWALEIMAYCHEHDLLPQFKFSYPDSTPHEDYFASFFGIRGSNSTRVPFVPISSIIELDLGKNYDHVLTLELADYLINKYLIINTEIVEEVEAFWHQHVRDRKAVGVHYRGSDRIVEAPAVPYDVVTANVERYLRRYPETQCIFVATDDPSFLETMRQTSFAVPVVFRDDALRPSEGSRSIDGTSGADRYAVNRDAIVNCLILARCDALLKTSSILSGWSKLLNPKLPTVMLNEPYAEHLWFPERELRKLNLFEPIRSLAPS